MRIWSTAWLLLVLTGTFLGLQLPLGRMAAAAGVPALTWTLLISCGAALALSPALILGSGLRWPDGRRLRFFAITATMSYALPNLLLFTVIPKVGAGYAGIMFTLSPICTLLFATMLRLKRPSRLGVVGLGAGFAGALLVAITRGGLSEPAAISWIAMALLIPLLLAAGNVYRTIDWPRDAGPVELAVGSHATAALLLAFSFVVLAMTYRVQRHSARAWPLVS